MKIKELISFEDFISIEKKLDIRLGHIFKVERIPKSDKMLKLRVIFGTSEEDEKTVVTNIGSKFSEDDLLGLVFPFIVNLKPVKIMGIISEAMIMIPSLDDEIYIESKIGSKLL